MVGLREPHLDDGEILADGGHLAPLGSSKRLVSVDEVLVPVLELNSVAYNGLHTFRSSKPPKPQ